MVSQGRNGRQSTGFSGATCSPIRHGGDAAWFQLRIGNYPHLLSAYGETAADAVVAMVCDHLAQLVAGDGVVERTGADLVEILIAPLAIFGGDLRESVCEAWIGKLCETVPVMPFETATGPVHLWLSGRWCLSGDPAGFGEWSFPFAGAAPGEGNWAAQYRADMAVASRALSVLDPVGIGDAGEGVRLCWQAVCNVEDGRIPYFEALARLFDRHDAFPATDSCILSLERTGMVRLFDLHMVRRVLRELDRAPDEVALAVNLSALSLGADPWWDDVAAQLRERPDIARRLLLEITETAAVPDISRAIAFVDRMRRLGCRIVIDDFGAGHASIRQLLAFAADIVKIDRIFAWRAAGAPRDQLLFVRLCALAASLGSIVVAEGVETPEQSRIAQDAGAIWQQGYFWSRPSYSRPWREAWRHSSATSDRAAERVGAPGSFLALG